MNTTSEKIILKGRKVIGGKVEGEALVSKMPLMGWGNVDPAKGYTTERNHPLFEVPFKGKFWFHRTARFRGFVSYGRSREFGNNPSGFLYRQGNNLTVFAAMVMQVPTMTDFDQDPTEVIETGDHVFINADEGYIEVTKKAQK